MGVIKKLKGKELVGWQQNPDVDVYPITHIGAVFNDQNIPLSDILNGLQQQISDGSGGGSSASTYPINYLWAYTTARTDSEALSKLNRSEQVDVPTNFVGNTSFTVPDGYYIYMTTARNQGGVYLRWEDNSIWSVPVRIGSGYTTSYTGNDGEGYNYAYCRTNNATPPSIPASLTVVRLEELSDNQGISASDGSISQASYNVWYDHPLGVDGTYQWEWIAISRGSDSAGWSAYTGPTLWSKFGVDGRDGDGIEYIFTALAEDAPTPQFINKYNGRIGEQSSDYQEVLIENCTSDSFYQQDDFIPSGWHDTPQVLSQEYNKQYVSIRKKQFTNENVRYWGPFSQPVLWAKINLSQGLKGAVIRNRGTWRYENVVYCCNTDMNGDGPTDNNMVYVDVVYYNGSYYQCRQHHSSNSDRVPTNTQYWQIAEDFEFIATKLIIADTADAQILSGGSVVVKDDQQNIVGGMTGGTQAATKDVIIWAGGQTPSSSSTKFKVYENGNAEISGVVKASMVYPKIIKSNIIDLDNNPASCYQIFNSGLAPIQLPRAQDYLGLELSFFCPLLPMNIRTRGYSGEVLRAATGEKIVRYVTEHSTEVNADFDVPSLQDSIYFDTGVFLTIKAVCFDDFVGYSSTTGVYGWIPIVCNYLGSFKDIIQ